MAAGSRRRPAAAAPALLAFASGLAVGASPLLVARPIGASGARVVTASSAVTAIRPRWLWEQGALDLGHALRGLAGLQVPLVVDGKERADLPAAARRPARGGPARRRRRGQPLAARAASPRWAAALAGAFWLSRRTGPDDLRYLYGLNAPSSRWPGPASRRSGPGAGPRR